MALIGLPKWRRSLTGVWIIIAATLIGGCATHPIVPSTQHQTPMGKVAIITTSEAPLIVFEGFPHSELAGAANGARHSFLTCVEALGGGGCSGEICGAVTILWLGICGIASSVGGVVGAVAAPTTDEFGQAQDVFSTALNSNNIQTSLRHQTEAAATGLGDAWIVGGEGADTQLEVALTEVSIVGAGIDESLLLRMRAHARVVRVRDSADIFSADYFFVGEKLKQSEWSANQSERLLANLRTGYKALASHIVDNVFLLYALPDRRPHSSGFLSSAFGLAPVFPRTRGQLSGDPTSGEPIAASGLAWSSVKTLQPTLQWQGFPRKTDVEAAPGDMGRVRNVRYDLVIAREHNLVPAEIIYQRSGLSDPVHTLETTLSPATHYFWTVRARFELDGRERVTEWSSTHFKIREQWTAPSLMSYRFRTLN